MALIYRGSGWLVGVPPRDLCDPELVELAERTRLSDDMVISLWKMGATPEEIAAAQAEATLTPDKLIASGLYALAPPLQCPKCGTFYSECGNLITNDEPRR